MRSINLFTLTHGIRFPRAVRAMFHDCRHRTSSYFVSISWRAMFELRAQIGTLDRGQHRQPMSYRHQPPFVFTETAASSFTFTFHERNTKRPLLASTPFSNHAVRHLSWCSRYSSHFLRASPGPHVSAAALDVSKCLDRTQAPVLDGQELPCHLLSKQTVLTT